MKAIFHRHCEIRSRTENVAWSIQPSEEPQTFPQECILLAVEEGAATIVEPTRKKKSKTKRKSTTAQDAPEV